MLGEELREEEPLKKSPGTVGTAKTQWKSLFNFFSRQQAPLLTIALFLSTAAGVTGPALAIFFGKIFDAFSAYGAGAADGDMLMHKVSTDSIALCVLGGTVWFLKGGCFALWMVFGELQAKNARDVLFQSLLEKDLEWYEMREGGIGALLPRLQTYVEPCLSLTVAGADYKADRFVSSK
jgi:ATP-binding cassette, subfamily B (MDR/TAP), member 1